MNNASVTARRTRRLLASVTLAGLVLVGAPLAAGADPATTTHSASYRHTLQVYRAAHRAIDHAYFAAVDAARATFRAALATATSPTARSQARSALQAAIATATATRANALSALGPPPTRP